MCHGQKSRFVGDGHLIPSLIGILISWGPINPYDWVEFPIPYAESCGCIFFPPRLAAIVEDVGVLAEERRGLFVFFPGPTNGSHLGVNPRIGVVKPPPNHPFVHRGFPLFSPSILGVFPLFLG